MRSADLETVIKAAVGAGNLLARHYNDVLQVSTKESVRDVVTQVDQMAEAQVISILRAHDERIPILSEENGVMGGPIGDRYWVVDALDGTVNYVNHISFFAVSIALVENGGATVGAVYNPMTSDLYYGAEGIGVFKNQSRMSIKDKPADECLYAVAFSGKNYEPAARFDEFKMMAEINDTSRGCLRTGSASMNLAYVAEGRLGGCWGKAGKGWDIAAGLLLAQLAGAKVVVREVSAEKHLVNYLVTVPSAFGYASSKLKDLILF